MFNILPSLSTQTSKNIVKYYDNYEKIFDYHCLSLPMKIRKGTGLFLEVFESEAGFTHSKAQSPIVATSGCLSCIALGGFNPTNKTAFVVHFYNEEEVVYSADSILSKLDLKSFSGPIRIHLTGGIKGRSEKIRKAIEISILRYIPNKIVSEDALQDCFKSKTLSIDSRTGEVGSSYPKVGERGFVFNPENAIVEKIVVARDKLPGSHRLITIITPQK